MASWKLLEVHTDDQTPHKWCVSLSEETFKRMFSHGSPTVHKIFGDGSLFSPMLFGKFFDPSDAFPLWDFESDVLLSNLRSSGKTSIDWFQTDDAYVLKADLFDPSDAFPLWDFESDVLLSNLRSSGKTSIDWFQTDDAYVLKADLPGVGSNIVQIYVENGKVMEISGQWKLQGDQSKTKDWRSGRWWEPGYVRRLELPEDVDWRETEASVSNDMVLELRIPKNTSNSGTSGSGIITKHSD